MASRIAGITVEIGGDTTKLQTALKSVNTEINSTQTQLKDVEKLLKLDPSNTELLAQKQALLTKAIEETGTKLTTLETAAKQANTALLNGEISQKQYDALQREIIATEQALESLEAQAIQSKSALEKIGEVGSHLQSLGSDVEQAGQKMLGVTAVVAGLGTAAVASASNFESGMSQVQATMGITSDAMSTLDGKSVNTMDTLSDLAKTMGSQTAYSASECAEAINYLALAGYDTQKMCDTLPKVLDLAAASGMDLASASDLVTDAMSALNMEVSEADVMVDQMAKTASSTNTSVAQLGEGILTIGATAQAIKGGTAELNTALGILADSGIKASEGGTALRNVILSLQTPTDKASELMEQLGVSVYDSQGDMRSMNDILGYHSMDGMSSAEKDNIISTIFNKTDLAAVNTLLGSTGDTWDSLQNSILDSSGAASQMAETQLDNLEGQLTILKSALEGLAISFGEILMPAIKSIAESLQTFLSWLNGLDETTQKMIVTIGLVVAAIGPILIVVGNVISAIGTIMSILPTLATAFTAVKTAFAALNAVMLANPIGLIIVAVTALVAGFIYLWNNCEAFRDFWIALWERVKEVAVVVWENLASFFATVWEGIRTVNHSIFQGISDFLGAIWEGIKIIFEVALTIISTIIGIHFEVYRVIIETVLALIKGIITGDFSEMQGIITTILTAVGNFISTTWNTIVNVISTILNTIKSIVTTVFTSIYTGISTTMGSIYNAIKGGFDNAVSFITNLISQASTWGKDLIAGLVSGIVSSISSVVNAVKDVANTIWSYLHFSVPEIGPLTDYESWMPDFMEGLSKGIEKSKSLVTSAVDSLSSDMVINPSVTSSDFSGMSEGVSQVSDLGSLVSMIKNAVEGVVGGDTIIPIYLGTTMLDEVIINAQQRTNLRSGGR
ncbi:MAG: phage tail tape measure protein [Eubacteriales bacterium]